MSVVDLSVRATDNYELYQNNMLSSDSYVFIGNNGGIGLLMNDGPTSIDLTIGDKCFMHSKDKFFTIPLDGVKVHSGQSILLETAQKVSVPLNIFGIITGKGRHIFSGLFLSTGKIDPGFDDNLKIGVYNGGPKSITLKKGEALCTCVFFQTESSLKNRPSGSTRMAQPSQVFISNWQIFKNWLDLNKGWIALIISLLSLIATTTLASINIYKLMHGPEKNLHSTSTVPAKEKAQ